MADKKKKAETIEELLSNLLKFKNKQDQLRYLERQVKVTELLDFDEYVEECWHYKGRIPSSVYSALALAGEAGEIANKIKKSERDSEGLLDKHDLALEAGDTLFYLVKFIHCLGLNLNDVVVMLQEKHRKGRKSAK